MRFIVWGVVAYMINGVEERSEERGLINFAFIDRLGSFKLEKGDFHSIEEIMGIVFII